MYCSRGDQAAFLVSFSRRKRKETEPRRTKFNFEPIDCRKLDRIVYGYPRVPAQTLY
jgi:hypothetical protein